MAGPYYVDDAGSDGDALSWGAAKTSLLKLDTAVAFASGEIVYFGADSTQPNAAAAALTVTGPAAGIPVKFISATTAGTAYQKSSTPQIDTSAGAYAITLDGSFALEGLYIKSGAGTFLIADADEIITATDTTFSLAHGGQLLPMYNCTLVNCTIDIRDTAASYSAVISVGTSGHLDAHGLSFSGAANRTETIFSVGAGAYNIAVSGADFSGFSNATTCELVDLGTNNYPSEARFTNCITYGGPATFLTAGRPRPPGSITFVNCGPANDPTALVYRNHFGDIVSSSSVYRTGGCSIESAPCSWLITTVATADEVCPFKTPWIYGVVASTGSKTFDLYVTNDTADFTDAQVWLEIESLNTTTEGLFSVSTDRRTITTTPVAQTDDTTSTWNGTGPSFTYKQKLSVTATVAVAGPIRARVCVGVASMGSSRYCYVDPKVTVS